MKILTAFFVRRPLLVRLIMLFILIAGALALRFQTYEMFPTIDLGIFTVTAYRPGSSPEDMELSITVPFVGNTNNGACTSASKFASAVGSTTPQTLLRAWTQRACFS